MQGGGFKINYESTSVTPDMTDRTGSCGGSFFTASGILTSPNDPRSEECIYTISLLDGSYVNVSIISMDVDCTNYIEMREGISEGSPIIGKWCGRASNISLLATNHLRIR